MTLRQKASRFTNFQDSENFSTLVAAGVLVSGVHFPDELELNDPILKLGQVTLTRVRCISWKEHRDILGVIHSSSTFFVVALRFQLRTSCNATMQHVHQYQHHQVTHHHARRTGVPLGVRVQSGFVAITIWCSKKDPDYSRSDLFKLPHHVCPRVHFSCGRKLVCQSQKPSYKTNTYVHYIGYIPYDGSRRTSQ